jgi:putative transcriptional regulator
MDPRFHKSVVYIYKHDENGAVGFIVNKPLAKSLWYELCNNAEVKNPTEKDANVCFGGPVDTQTGFVLHTAEYDTEFTEKVTDLISITQGLHIIADIAQGLGPREYIIILGYSSWTVGQLEMEIEAPWPRQAGEGWLVIDFSSDIAFGFDYNKKWEKAVELFATNTVDKLLEF